MNWDRMEGTWKQRRGSATHHWGKVMNDDLAAIAGRYEQLVGRLQERYGIAKEQADRQVKDFKRTIGQLKKSNSRLIRLQKTLRNRDQARLARAGARRPTKRKLRSK